MILINRDLPLNHLHKSTPFHLISDFVRCFFQLFCGEIVAEVFLPFRSGLICWWMF